MKIDFALSNWRKMTMREAILHFWPEAAGAKPEICDFASHDSVAALVKRYNAAGSHMAYNPAEPTGKTIANLFEAVAKNIWCNRRSFTSSLPPFHRSPKQARRADWVERFEIFAGKIGNRQRLQRTQRPEEQRRRFEHQIKERERGDDEAHQNG